MLQAIVSQARDNYSCSTSQDLRGDIINAPTRFQVARMLDEAVMEGVVRRGGSGLGAGCRVLGITTSGDEYEIASLADVDDDDLALGATRRQVQIAICIIEKQLVWNGNNRVSIGAENLRQLLAEM